MVSSAAASTTAVTVEEARRVLLAGLPAPAAEEVDLGEALGRVLADDVVAATDLPGADNSAMDGYAVLASDVAGAGQAAPLWLPVGLEARAGHPVLEHRPGTATVIATGASMPIGADAVVAVEQTTRDGERVGFLAAPAAGAFVRRRGEDVRAGQALLRAGTRLRSVDVGVCAAAGVARPRVARRPRVALLSTGDELVAPGTVPQPHQVTDVNTAMLAAAVAEAGGVVVSAGTVDDDPAVVMEALQRARDSADIIVSSAGVSMGGHDHVRDCVAELGSVDQWTVAMRPGRPLVVGSVGAVRFVGLPGNPVSSAVTFLLFARPAILALQGATSLLPRLLPVVLGDAFEKPPHLQTYLRVHLEPSAEGLLATLSGGQGSAMMHGLAGADALAVLPAGTGIFPAGTSVQAMLLP